MVFTVSPALANWRKQIWIALVSAIVLACTAPLHAQNVNYDVVLPCGQKHVAPPPRIIPNISKGFQGTINFRLVPTPGRQIVFTPGSIIWVYPGRNAGDRDWGAWTGQGTPTLTWTPPASRAGYGSFGVAVSGKARCVGGRGGKDEEFTFAVSWEGVVDSDWQAEPPIGFAANAETTRFSLTSGGTYFFLSNFVYPGQQLHVTLSGLQDADTYVPTNTTEADKVTSLSWIPSAGTASTPSHTKEGDAITASEIDWTAPSTPPAGEGWLVIKAIANDAAPAVPAGQTGSRDDSPREIRLLLKMTAARTWTRAAPPQNQSPTNIEAHIVRPVKPDAGQQLKVAPGAAVDLEATGSDTDYWTRATGEPLSGSETDKVSFQWEVKKNGQNYGTIQDVPGADNSDKHKAIWQVPADAQPGATATIKVTVNDTKDTVPTGDAGNRNDDPVTDSIDIVIDDNAPTISSIALSPENPFTSGKNNAPPAPLTFSANLSDPQNQIQSVEWKWLGTNLSQTKVRADNDWSWTIGAVPWDLAHQEYEVECTIVWGVGQNQRASQRRKFKLFFDKYGHDEDLSTTRSITGYSPPNWFDARPNHWGSVVPRLNETWYGGYLWGSYSLNAGLFVYWRFNNIIPGNLPPGSVLISNVAAESAGATASYVYAPVAEGIDACAATVLHEFQHKTQMEQSWGVSNWSDLAALDMKIGPNGAWVRDGAVFDKDQDFIKDSWEVTQWKQDPVLTDPYLLNKKYDGNAFETDEEFDADMHGGRTHAIGSLNNKDWATPGKQTNRQ